MTDAELNELVALLTEGDGGVDLADRLATLLAGAAAPDPRAVETLIGFRWRQFLTGPAGTGRPLLEAMAHLAATLPADRQAQLPLGLRVLISVDPGVTGDPKAWHAAALAAEFGVDRSIELLSLTAHTLPPASPLLGLCLANLSNQHYRRFLDRDRASDLDEAIAALRAAAALFDDSYHQLAYLLDSLSQMLRTRYRATGTPEDLDDAIVYASRAADLPSQDPVTIISGLSIALRYRYERYERDADLAEGLAAAQQAAGRMRRRYPEAGVVLTNLATLLSYRHQRTGDDDDLDKAIDAARKAAAPARADALDILAELLALRYRLRERRRDLDDALQAVTARLSLAPPASPDRDEQLRLQRNLLFWRFLDRETRSDLDAAIRCATDLHDPGPDDADALANLLHVRYQVARNLADAAQSVLLRSGWFVEPSGRPHPRSATARRVFERLLRTPDPALLFDEELDAHADTLMDLPLGGARDLRAHCMLGWLFWFRAAYRDDPQAAQRDRLLAAALLYPVYQVAPTFVPRQVAEQHGRIGDTGASLNEAGMYWLHRYEQTAQEADAQEAIGLFRRAIEAAGPDDPEAEANAANNLAVVVLALPADRLTEQLAVEAVRALQRSVDLSQPTKRYLPGRLSGLCGALVRLYALTGDAQALDDAIATGRRAVALTSDGHPSAGLHLANLAGALACRPDPTPADRAETIEVYQRAVAALPPEHRKRPAVLANLATALDGADRAAALREAATAAQPGPDRIRILRSVLDQAWRTDDPVELAGAIAAGRELLALMPAGTDEALGIAVEVADLLRLSNPGLADEPPAREEAGIRRSHLDIPATVNPATAARLCLNGMNLLDLADALADAGLRADAVTALRNAVNAAGPDDPRRTRYQACLVTGLRERYLRTRDVALLHEEIALADAVLQATPDDHPDLLIRLEAGIWVLQRLHSDTGDRGRLAETHARAVRAAQHPDATWTNRVTLAEVLMERGLVEGDDALLEKAVRLGRQAIAEDPDGSEDHHRSVGNFATLLLQYYQVTGASDVLDDAIATARRAGDAFTGVRNTLGQSLWLRYQRTGAKQDLRESAAVQRAAVAAVPVGYPYRAIYLDNLRDILLALGILDDDPTVLREAADHGRAAVAAAGGNASFRAVASAGVADVLLSLYERERDPAALAEARAAAEQGVRDGDGHHQRGYLLQVLARTLTATEDPTLAARARDLYAEAATHPAAANHNRLLSAAEWARLAMALDDADDALRACEHAADVLLVHTGPALQRGDREYGLRDAAWLPRTAAAAAIAAGRPDRAVELLEQVRGILLAEALHARQDLDGLRADDPDLAAEFTRVSTELATIDGRSAAEGRAELVRRWHDTVERIRRRPGQADFLRPPSAARLQDGIDSGWMVVLNASEWRSDAIVLDGTDVSVVELTGLRADDAVDCVNAYLTALQEFQTAQDRLAAARAEALHDLAARHRYQAAVAAFGRQLAAMEEALQATLEWLWDAVAEPVLRRLGLTAPPAGEVWPRIWWCPTGALALLPLHAAGRHRAGTGESVIDRVVSSYAPTVRAFQVARTAAPAGPDGAKALIVAMPATADRQPLPNADRERDLLLDLFPGAAHTLLEGADATRDTVLRELPHHGWIHLSCHGDQDLHEPSRGGVLLADGVLSVVDLNRHGQRAELTFLSACKTATTGVELIDEMMTLAAAMHYGGSRHVIGTLWSVYDDTAADVSEKVYRWLARDGRPTVDAAALALHHATRRLRRSHPDRPSTWIPFVHIGP